MTDNNDDEIEGVLIINIHNTVNISLDRLTATNGGDDNDATSNSLRSGEAPADDDERRRRVLELEREIRDSLQSDQNSGTYINTVNISPDARFFRAGKGDDENNAINTLRALIRAGKDDDENNIVNSLKAMIRAGKGDDENNNINAIRAMLRAGKGDDENDDAILRNIGKILEIEADSGNSSNNKPQEIKKPGAARAIKKTVKKKATPKRGARGN